MGKAADIADTYGSNSSSSETGNVDFGNGTFVWLLTNSHCELVSKVYEW